MPTASNNGSVKELKAAIAAIVFDGFNGSKAKVATTTDAGRVMDGVHASTGEGFSIPLNEPLKLIGGGLAPYQNDEMDRSTDLPIFIFEDSEGGIHTIFVSMFVRRNKLVSDPGKKAMSTGNACETIYKWNSLRKLGTFIEQYAKKEFVFTEIHHETVYTYKDQTGKRLFFHCEMK